MRKRISALLILAGFLFLPAQAEEAKKQDLSKKIIIEPILHLPSFIEEYAGKGAEGVTMEQYVERKMKIAWEKTRRGYPKTRLNKFYHDKVLDILGKKGQAYFKKEFTNLNINHKKEVYRGGNVTISLADDQDGNLRIDDKDIKIYREKRSKKEKKE